MRFADPFTEIDNLRRHLERAFTPDSLPYSGIFSNRGGWNYPLVNVGEDEDKVYVEVMVPGVSPENVDLSVLRDELTIKGSVPPLKKTDDQGRYIRNERSSGEFTRTVTLPAEVDDKKASAQYRNGILSIEFPKAEAAKPKQIKVEVA